MKNICIFFVFLLVVLNGCTAQVYPELETVAKVDVQKYSGKWFEIARMPFSRQENCTCTTAEYGILDESTLSVLNTCYDTTKNSFESASGKAFVVENSGNARLKVQFFWPFKGDYWIIGLDTTGYTYAVVGMPSRKYAWILSRTPTMPEALLQDALGTLRKSGYDTKKLIFTKQDKYEKTR